MKTFALILAVASASAFAFDGRVVPIADGDTVTVLDSVNEQHKIRVAGIDAPEKRQDFGDRSKTNLGALVFGRDVDIVGNKTDRYGRTVAKVMVAEPNCNNPSCPKLVDAGLEQVKAGLAWWYRRYAREQSPEDRTTYEQAEFEAKIRRLGLWSAKNPVPPWDFRRGARE